jgi:chaperonin cofactor prefoldin
MDNNELQKLIEENKELKLKLEEERMVKKGEVLMNTDLKTRNEKLELHIETLLKINEEFSDKIAKLRCQLKNIINKT